MAQTGDRFDMPDGSIYEVTAAAADSGGEFVGMTFTYPPGSIAPPPHVHPAPAEEFEVLEGSFDLMVAGEWRTLGVGESATVPAGMAHTFKNRSGKTVRVRNVHRPPARFEDYIEHLYQLTRSRGIKSTKDPRLIFYLPMVMLEYPETLQASRARERIGFAALACLGRLFRLDTTP